MKITFTAWLSIASTKTVQFLVHKINQREDSQIDFTTGNVSLSGRFIQERFSHFSNNRFFKQTNCQKTLSVRKNLTVNTNLGQTSCVNWDKFGIGNDVPVIYEVLMVLHSHLNEYVQVA